LNPWPARHRRALALGGFATLCLSLQMLLQSTLFEFWTPWEIATAWLEYLGEQGGLALLLYAAYLGLDAACLRWRAGRWQRLAWMTLAFYALALGYTLLGMGWRSRFAVAPDLGFAAVLAGRLAIVAAYLVGVQTLWLRARDAEARAQQARLAAATLERESRQRRLQLLRAQLEPHFLFNTLANMRRLYRTEPERAGPMMQSLKCYLRAALPRVRRDDATLGDELALVQAYLMLISMRMPARLAWHVDDASGCAGLAFPPMLVLTLVENAIRHGIEPSPTGGRVDVSAQARGGWLSVHVRDSGVGLDAAQPSGTGVGLTNARSQLRARFGPQARLALLRRQPGVEAVITLPTEGA
jgi:hypothetical protein